MIELTFPNQLILTRQVNQKSVISVTIGIGFEFQPDVCKRYHGVYEP